jgi:hypothetical protein
VVRVAQLRLAPLHLDHGLVFARGDRRQQLLVASTLGALSDERPHDVALRGHEVEVVQIAQHTERAGPGPVEQVAVQVVGCIARVLPVVLRGGKEPLGVPAALLRQLPTGVHELGLLGMLVGDCVERVGQTALGLVEQCEVVRQVHAITRSRRAGPARRRPCRSVAWRRDPSP